MAHDRNNQPDIHRTEQGVLNRSFDETYQVLAVESLVFNPTTNTLDREEKGFGAGSDITTTISGDVITQTDGVKTLTITISGGTITEVWT